MKKEYRIDWQTNTFTMTKKFAAEANHYGTEAYNMLMDARAKGFNLVVRKEKKPRKVCPTRITFKQMEIILSCMDYADERLAQLHAVMDAGKGQKNQYEYVRRWFLENYVLLMSCLCPDIFHLGYLLFEVIVRICHNYPSLSLPLSKEVESSLFI